MCIRPCVVWEERLWIYPFPVTQKEEFREYETSHCVGGSGLRKTVCLKHIHTPTQFLASFWQFSVQSWTNHLG